MGSGFDNAGGTPLPFFKTGTPSGQWLKLPAWKVSDRRNRILVQ